MDKKICSVCGDKPLGELIEQNGKLYCQSCFDDKFFKCDDCGEIYERGNEYEYNGELICQDCYDINYFICEGCGEVIHNDSEYSHREYVYCETCFDERYFYCDSCGESFPNGEHCHCEGGGSLDDIVREFWNRRDYDTFGVEVEAEGGDYDKLVELPKTCGIHRDGSLDDSGVEVVSPPLPFDMLGDYIKQVSQVMKSAGFNASERCGLHIHAKINIEDLIKKIKNKNAEAVKRGLIKKQKVLVDVLKYLTLIIDNIEPAIYALQPKSRRDCRWCDSLGRSRRELLGWIYNNKPLTLRSFSNTPTRYIGTNFQALNKYGTVEFRYSSGTVEADKIINWAGFLNTVIQNAKEMERLKYSYKKDYEKKLNKLVGLKKYTGKNHFKMTLDWLGISQDDYKLAEYLEARYNKFNKLK
jgi:hypothetical protein